MILYTIQANALIYWRKKLQINLSLLIFKKKTKYFLVYFDSTLVITSELTFPTIQQLFKKNQISLIYFIPNDSYEITRKQIDDSIQLEKTFINEEQIINFLDYAFLINFKTTEIEKHEYETISAHLLQKSYIESRILAGG